jgi:PAH dioxygenase small subunit
VGSPVSAREAAMAGVPIGSTEYNEVLDWLYREARLLDHGDFTGWLALMTDDIAYEIPNRVDVAPKEGEGFDSAMSLFVENHASLTTRVQRLATDQAWAEQPRSRTKHFVSNLLLEKSAEGELHATSALLVTRLRAHRPQDVLTGERHDVLRRVGGALKLAKRTVLMDQTTLESHNLSIFF